MKSTAGHFNRRQFVAGSAGSLGLSRTAFGQQTLPAIGTNTLIPISPAIRSSVRSGLTGSRSRLISARTGSGMRSSGYGPTGVHSAFLNRAIGMPVECMYRVVLNTTITSRRMGIPLNLGTRTSAISGEQKTGTPTNSFGYMQRLAPNISSRLRIIMGTLIAGIRDIIPGTA